jgi:cold shock CspA family protein/ribosome-associated translation inhibitor RaiA
MSEPQPRDGGPELSISWRHMDPSPALVSIITERARHLGRLHPGLLRLRAMLETPQAAHPRSGAEITVHLHLDLPGPDLDATASVRHSDIAENAVLAVDAAFGAIERQLRGHVDRLRHAQDVRLGPGVAHGTITELEPELGWGMLRADTGEEVYVQRDSLVAGRWDDLRPGARLRFRLRRGDKGPFATDVAPAGR